MAFVFEIEAVTVTRAFQRLRAVDEELDVFDVVFIMKFGKELVCEDVRPGLFERCFYNPFVSGSTAAYGQFFVVESDHCLIHRDEIRDLAGHWL